MSDKMNNKQDGAIRLFGALSGVDERYLAACEADKGDRRNGVLVFMHKYGKGMAAVLCLAILGAGYLMMQPKVSMDTAESVMEAPDHEMNMMAVNQGAAQEAAPEAVAEEELLAADTLKEPGAAPDGVVEDYAAEKEFESGSSVSNSAGQLSEGAKAEADVQTVGAREEKQDAFSCIDEIDAGAVEMSMEDVKSVAVVGAYVPTNWPAQGSVALIKGLETPGAEEVEIRYQYENQKDSIVVNVINLGVEIPGFVQEEMDWGMIWPIEEFDRECVAMSMETSVEDGSGPEGQFGVLYEEETGYVLVYFKGNGSVDDIWQLLK